MTMPDLKPISNNALLTDSSLSVGIQIVWALYTYWERSSFVDI